MATYQSVFIPASPTSGAVAATATLQTATIAAGGTQTVILAPRQLFAITVNGNCSIRFGNVTKPPTATAADWPIWSTSVQEWEMGEEFDRISIFNNTGGNIIFWVYAISAK